MLVLGTDHIVAFAQVHADARSALSTWQREVASASWKSPADIKLRYPKASIIDKENVVFDIRGGSYRLHARVSFVTAVVIVMRIGTHADYDRWNF